MATPSKSTKSTTSKTTKATQVKKAVKSTKAVVKAKKTPVVQMTPDQKVKALAVKKALLEADTNKPVTNLSLNNIAPVVGNLSNKPKVGQSMSVRELMEKAHASANTITPVADIDVKPPLLKEEPAAKPVSRGISVKDLFAKMAVIAKAPFTR